MLTRCAVLGQPIAHSLSPVLHRAAYQAAGLDWTYDAVEIGSEDLPGFLSGLDASWRGLSLTMPLKRTVVPLLDELTERAAQAQAVNTVILHDNKRTGHNTDVPGAAAAIRERYHGPLDSVVIAGAGATAASVALAVADLGCARIDLLVRSRERAAQTLAAVARHPHPPEVGFTPGAADLVVSTVPAHAQAESLLGLVDTAAAVFEVVYDPWPTPLASATIARRLPLISGLDLLVHQAVLQYRLMTGRDDDPLATMRAAGEAALEDGS